MSRVRVADASARLHPAAVVQFLVDEDELETVQERLKRYSFQLEAGACPVGWIAARVERRAGYVHITEALADLHRSGLIRSRVDNDEGE